MADLTGLSACRMISWCGAALVGVIVLWLTTGALGGLGALLVALALAALLGLGATRFFCNAEGPGRQGPVSGRESGRLSGQGDASTAHAPEAEPQGTPEPSGDLPEPGSKVRSGTLLEGEQDLAVRPGSWRYDGDSGKASSAGGEGSGKGAPAKSAGAAPDTAAPSDGTRPTGLPAPRGGQADDLKQLKGVGPKLEAMLHDLGIYHFDQIAGWSAEEVAWFDANLKGFPGRVSREKWVEQARILARGGKTEIPGEGRTG